MTFRSEAIARALLAKGFREVQGRHRKFILWHQGKPTSIRTELSHGSKEVGAPLLSMMKRQLRLETIDQLKALIECPMEGEDYIAFLKNKGVTL
jgi:hypothetical protein